MTELHQAVQIALEGHDRPLVISLDPRTLAAVLRTSWVPREGTEHLHAALMGATDDELHTTAHDLLEEQ